MNQNTELLTRVREMDARYDELTRVLAGLEEAVSEYKAFKPDLEILKEYKASGQWKEDCSSAEAGQLPAEAKRGVLFEESLDSLLQDADKLVEQSRTILQA